MDRIPGTLNGLYECATEHGYPVLPEYSYTVPAHRDLLCYLIAKDLGLPTRGHTPWIRHIGCGMFGSRWSIAVNNGVQPGPVEERVIHGFTDKNAKTQLEVMKRFVALKIAKEGFVIRVETPT